MAHERNQQLRSRASDLHAAVKSLLAALQRDVELIDAQLHDARDTGTSDDIQRLSEQRDRWSRDRDVLQDQVPTLERLASGGARQGREAAALIYIEQLAQAFLLAVDDISARARHTLSPVMIERMPGWEVELARASVADTELATTLLKRLLDEG